MTIHEAIPFKNACLTTASTNMSHAASTTNTFGGFSCDLSAAA